MKKTIVNSPHFKAWASYFGCLVTSDEDERFPSALFGFENITPSNSGLFSCTIPSMGACYGFVGKGGARVFGSKGFMAYLSEGNYFCTRSGLHMELGPDSAVMVTQALGFDGLPCFGGPVEALGRLRYIDGCSDSLLVAPPMRGDPCFNHLHFPPKIDQTQHTHPSTRFGFVYSGLGLCRTPLGDTPLRPGLIFWIPKDGLHKFATSEQHMDVIAYHPDSDFGPTHQDHPMVNRTLVDGTKIDNTDEKHKGVVMDTRFPVVATPGEYHALDLEI